MSKPRIFIGSAGESIPVVDALLDHEFETVPWYGDVFGAGGVVIDGLLEQVRRASMALFVFSEDDVVTVRGNASSAVRDNVLFELGLFLGHLGRERALFLVPKGADLRIPTDLLGIEPVHYDADRFRIEPKAAMAPAAAKIKGALRKLLFGDGTVVSLTGRWKQTWHVDSHRYPPKVTSGAEVSQMGSHLEAVAVSKGRPFITRGKIENGNVVTGRWFDKEAGATYFGAFQLLIDPLADRMDGQWVGFSSTGVVKSGRWEWDKETDGSDGT